MPRKANYLSGEKKAHKPGWPNAFIRALRRNGNVTDSCVLARINPTTAFRLRSKNPKFAAAWENSIREFADRVESEAHRRAMDGVLEPVFQGGKLVGKKRVYSDTLLLEILRAKKPTEYRQRQTIEHAVAATAIDPAKTRRMLADPELARLQCEMDARMAELAREPEAHLHDREDRTTLALPSVPEPERFPESGIIDVTPSDP